MYVGLSGSAEGSAAPGEAAKEARRALLQEGRTLGGRPLHGNAPPLTPPPRRGDFYENFLRKL